MAQTMGPGIPDITFSQQELFRPISIIRSVNMAGEPRGNGLVTMHKGYLAVPFGRNSGVSGGGFEFYDISNPFNPRLINRVDSELLRESHGFARSSSYPGDYVVMQAGTGIQFWDWTDVRNPRLLSHFNLPGANFSDYDVAVWWLAWQAPYVYAGGSANGIYIVDATDPTAPVLVNRIPTSVMGGFRTNSVFAVGNLLVAMSADFNGNSTGIVTLDISDPANPVVLNSRSQGLPIMYAAFFNGNRVYGSGNSDHSIHVWDLTNPAVFNFIGSLGGMDRPVYTTIQDNFAFVGDETSMVKVNMDSFPYTIVGSGTSGIGNRSEDIVTPLGNMVFVGNDVQNGSAIIPHQAAPDRLGPSVNMVNPRNNAVNQALTSRVGITLTDWPELLSVNSNTFIVREVGGQALSGKYGGEQGILNFWPDQPLKPDTTYEVVIPAGGITDFSGNPTPQTFTSHFSTGSQIVLLNTDVRENPPAATNSPVSFDVTSTSGPGPYRYSWNFGDGTPSTALSTSPAASHTYTQPGRYLVGVTVSNGTSQSTDTYLQVVHNPLTGGSPAASSTVIVDDNDNAWAVNADSDTVTKIDGSQHSRLLEAPVGRNPRTLAQAPDGTIWVVNQGDASISVLNPFSGGTVQTIALPSNSHPYGIVFSPDGGSAYVTTQGSGELLRLDPVTGAIEDSLALGAPVRGIAVTHDSARILVTRFISPDNRGEVFDIGAASFTVFGVIALAFDPGPDGNTTGRGLPNYNSSIAISPDGLQARVPGKKDNIQRGQARDGQPLNFETTVRTIASYIDLGGGAEDLSMRLDFNDRDMANAIVYSPLGDLVFVAMQGSNTVEIFDAYDNRLISGIPDTGLAPQGLALSNDGNTLYVQNFMSR
jgi:DNA-binding beta-propeller fold protein YncE